MMNEKVSLFRKPNQSNLLIGTMQPLQIALVPELRKISNRVAQASHLAVAHNRKFTFICAQFERFAAEYEKIAKPVALTAEMIQAYRDILSCANKFITIFSQNDMQGWAHNALEHSCAQVATDITTIITTLQITAVALCPTASRIFNPTSAQWLQYHLLDIKAIASSFEQYIQSSNSLSIEKEVTDAMLERIKSIEKFCEQYKNEEVPPGCVVFSPIPVHYQKWRLNPSDFICEERIGHGVSASVFYGHLKKDNRKVAIKKLKYKHLSGAKLQTFQREITIFATCNHPCILKFIGATDSHPFCIVSEWMSGGNLFHDLHKVHSLDATFLSLALFDIARGMAFLHSRQIMHRDLKSLNILIDENKLTHICDFGFSRKTGEKDEKLTKNVGTPIWMAPELLNTSNVYDLKIDVYAFAIVAWEILTGDTPYGNAEPSQIIGDVLVHDARPIIPEKTPKAFARLITQCWDRDPAKRPEFSEIVQRICKEHIIMPEADKEYVFDYMRKAGYDPDQTEDDDPLSMNIPSLDSILQLDHNSPAFFSGIVQNLKSERGLDAAKAFRQLTEIPESSCMDAIALVPTGNEAIDYEIIVALCKNGYPGPACLHALKNEHIQLTFEVIAKKGLNFVETPNEKVEKFEISEKVEQSEFFPKNASKQPENVEKSEFSPKNTNEQLENVEKSKNIEQSEFSPKNANEQLENVEKSELSPKNVEKPEKVEKPEISEIEKSQNRIKRNADERAAVIDRCVHSIQCSIPNENYGLIISALKCLMKIKGISEIPFSDLRELILSDNVQCRIAASIIAAKLADDGIKLSLEIVDLMIQKWKTDLVSCLVVVAACQNKEIAEHVMEYINSGDVPNETALTNLVTKLSIHKELHSNLKAFIEATIAQSKDKQISVQANALLKKISSS